MSSTTNEKYFSDYNNLQYIKHRLIREYLNGWYPKLGSWSGRIVYLDTHAGRGKHNDGQTGSPVVAMQTLLEHGSRDFILDKSETNFHFIEHDEGNVEILHKAIDDLGTLPMRMQVSVSQGDCFSRINSLLDELDRNGKRMAPAFVFVDPYGFKLPCETMKRLLSAGRVELFVNIIWRELFMGIAHAQKAPDGVWGEMMTLIFGSDKWKIIDRRATPECREIQVIDMLATAYGAKWVTSMRMLHENHSTRYLLAHFTNHDSGRDLMKDCMWKVCPHGEFTARRSDNPNQETLISPDPDLSPLEDDVLGILRAQPKYWQDLIAKNRQSLWREPHLNKVVRKLRKEGRIVGTEHTGPFAPKNNPLLTLAEVKVV